MVALPASVSATATAAGMATKLCYSKTDYRRIKPAKKVMPSTNLAIQYPTRISSQNAKGSLSVRALGPQNQGDDEYDNDGQQVTNTTAFTSQEDLDYLWKLVTGSIVGAAIIKYGSVVFPEITRPNITQALLMILIPVIVAVLLLVNQSRKEEPS